MLLLGIGAASAGTAQPPTPTPERGVLFRTVHAEGGEHRYAVYVPRDLDPGRPAPAILFLNGRGECGTDGTRQLAVGLLPAVFLSPAEWPFVIVFPQKPTPQSTWADHEELAMACLAAASREFRLDPSRVYLTGLSQGGAGAWSIGSDHPGVFAAIAPVCGFAVGAEAATGGPARFGDDAACAAIASRLAKARTPVWAFHGEKDDAVPVAQTRRLMAALEKAGWSSKEDVRATYDPQAGHNCWDRAYRDEGLAAWFLEHRRGRGEEGVGKRE